MQTSFRGCGAIPAKQEWLGQARRLADQVDHPAEGEAPLEPWPAAYVEPGSPPGQEVSGPLPGPPEAPAVIWYDSDYAAGIVLRPLLPQANLALAERAVMLYGLVSGKRPVELRWVKGHSYERGVGVVDPCVSWGNHVADWLADR